MVLHVQKIVVYCVTSSIRGYKESNPLSLHDFTRRSLRYSYLQGEQGTIDIILFVQIKRTMEYHYKGIETYQTVIFSPFLFLSFHLWGNTSFAVRIMR